MSHSMAIPPLPRRYWVISLLALVWNVIGILTYLMSVRMTPEAIAAMPAAEQGLYADIPAWVTSAYAIGVFGGTLGSLGLLLLQRWALPVLTASLVGIVVQMGHALFMTELLAVRGGIAAVLPLMIVVVAAYLVWFARSAQAKGWTP